MIKHGALTKDEFNVKGIVDIDSYEPEFLLDCKEEAFIVLLGCNSLVNIDGRISGNPLILQFLKK